MEVLRWIVITMVIIVSLVSLVFPLFEKKSTKRRGKSESVWFWSITNMAMLIYCYWDYNYMITDRIFLIFWSITASDSLRMLMNEISFLIHREK